MIEQDIINFYKSINQEFDLIKNRVRSIIGNKHWGEDGKYKEAILKNMINKFLPNNYSIGSGFIINSIRETTSQIDIFIYDNNTPTIFKEGDFVIIPASGVKAIIEVKTKIYGINGKSDNQLKNILIKFEKNTSIIKKDIDLSNVFLGIFSYEFDIDSLNIGDFDLETKSKLTLINHISLGNKYFFKKFTEDEQIKMHIYSLENLSFAYFISNLMNNLSDWRKIYHEKLLFPLNSKEIHKIFEISIN